MICDGSAGKGKTPYYANTCENLRREFIKNLQIFGKVEVKVYEAKTGVTYIMFPKAITDILSHIFKVPLVGPRKFPERLFSAPTECQMIALRAMFDDEGFVSKKGQMGFTTSDIEMVEGVTKLLTQNGFIVGTIRKKKRGNKTDFTVPILVDSYEKFLDLIDFTHPQKHKRLKMATERHKYRIKYKPLKTKIHELLLSCHPLDRIEIANRLNAKIPMTKMKLYELRHEGKIYNKFNGKNKFYLWFPKG
jgi:hypothetical protein